MYSTIQIHNNGPWSSIFFDRYVVLITNSNYLPHCSSLSSRFRHLFEVWRRIGPKIPTLSRLTVSGCKSSKPFIMEAGRGEEGKTQKRLIPFLNGRISCSPAHDETSHRHKTPCNYVLRSLFPPFCGAYFSRSPSLMDEIKSFMISSSSVAHKEDGCPVFFFSKESWKGPVRDG